MLGNVNAACGKALEKWDPDNWPAKDEIEDETPGFAEVFFGFIVFFECVFIRFCSGFA